MTIGMLVAAVQVKQHRREVVLHPLLQAPSQYARSRYNAKPSKTPCQQKTAAQRKDAQRHITPAEPRQSRGTAAENQTQRRGAGNQQRQAQQDGPRRKPGPDSDTPEPRRLGRPMGHKPAVGCSYLIKHERHFFKCTLGYLALQGHVRLAFTRGLPTHCCIKNVKGGNQLHAQWHTLTIHQSLQARRT